jgi:hypothetical protein
MVHPHGAVQLYVGVGVAVGAASVDSVDSVSTALGSSTEFDMIGREWRMENGEWRNGEMEKWMDT